MSADDTAGVILLCDPCWTAATEVLLPECQDGCARSLDHDGLCTEERRTYGRRETCQWCGQPGRLTVMDRSDVEWDRMPTVGQEPEGVYWLNWPADRQGPFPSPSEAWEQFHADAEKHARDYWGGRAAR